MIPLFIYAALEKFLERIRSLIDSDDGGRDAH